MRLFNGRVTRKTPAFSKEVETYRASAAWEDLYYNLPWVYKPLQVEVLGDPQSRWQQRSPAMAAGLTAHVRAAKDLLRTAVPPSLNNTDRGTIPWVFVFVSFSRIITPRRPSRQWHQ